MYGRIGKSERILTKLRVLGYEYICDRIARFHKNILFTTRGINIQRLTTGVRQGCILSPFLFLIVMDFVMRKTTNGHDFGIVWGQKKLADLDFADDLVLWEGPTPPRISRDPQNQKWLWMTS